MPSWSTFEGTTDGATPPTAAQTDSELDSARRLLEQLFAEPESDDQAAQPE